MSIKKINELLRNTPEIFFVDEIRLDYIEFLEFGIFLYESDNISAENYYFKNNIDKWGANWILENYGVEQDGNFGLTNLIYKVTKDEKKAIDIYFRIYDDFYKQKYDLKLIKKEMDELNLRITQLNPDMKLVDTSNVEKLINRIRQRPGAFVYKIRLDYIYYLIKGYLFCSANNKPINEIDEYFEKNFNKWVAEKLKFHCKIEKADYKGFYKSIYRFTDNDEKKSVELFFKFSEEFFSVFTSFNQNCDF